MLACGPRRQFAPVKLRRVDVLPESNLPRPVFIRYAAAKT